MRKRWDGQDVYLIHLTHSLKIDHFSEAVWDKLDGAHTFEKIVGDIALLYPEYESVEVGALVSANIINFYNAGYIEAGEKTNTSDE